MKLILLLSMAFLSIGLGYVQQKGDVGHVTGCGCTTTTTCSPPEGAGSCLQASARQGKRGPKGLKGDKGEEPEDRPETIRQMQSKIKELTADLKVYWKLSTSFPSSCAEYMQYGNENRKFEQVPLFIGKQTGSMVPIVVNCTEIAIRGFEIEAELTTTRVPTTTQTTTTATSTITTKGATYILVGQRTQLSLITMNTSAVTSLVPYSIDAGNVVGLDYDAVTKYMYWSGNNVIKRAKTSDSVAQTIVSGLSGEVDGVAVDWVAGNLYWTDKVRSVIEVSRVDGTSRKSLISTDIEYPRAIVLDPAKGNLYWSDWGTNEKIERASLDGGDRRVMASGSMKWPNGMTLDYERNCLYWVDSSLDKIEKLDLDSLTRTILAQFPQHIFGFSYLNDYLYWTDWQGGALERLPVSNPTFRHTIGRGGRMMGIKAYDDTPRTETNGCSIRNGGCSNLCFYTPTGVKCSCPENYALLGDRKTCRAT